MCSQECSALFCRVWRKRVQETHSVLLSLLGLNENSAPIKSRAVASSSVAAGGLGFSPAQLPEWVFRDVGYSLPMESNTLKPPHSTRGSGSERSLCATAWGLLGASWSSELPFLQVGELPLSQLISSLHAARLCHPGASGVSSALGPLPYLSKR